MPDKKLINVLLADDDEDDRNFFVIALKKVSLPSKLVCVNDGEELMNYLSKSKSKLPDILFLDINMPRKNGYECLVEIKANAHTKNVPVIMYSTSLKDSMADMLYENGAGYYLRKSGLADLDKYLQLLLTMLQEKTLQKPVREEFALNEMRAV